GLPWRSGRVPRRSEPAPRASPVHSACARRHQAQAGARRSAGTCAWTPRSLAVTERGERDLCPMAHLSIDVLVEALERGPKELGLYPAVADGGARTGGELAARTGCAERWVREWLCQQGAAGVLEYRGDGRFALPPEGRAVLADESSPACGVGFFAHLPGMMGIVERLPEAFRSGIGLPYDAFGAEGAGAIERGFAPWFRTMLVPFALPQVPGLVERL